MKKLFDGVSGGEGEQKIGPGWIKTVAVYCGSRNGNTPVFIKEAYKLGRYIAQQNMEMVYGGGDVGLMGAVKAGARDYNRSVGKDNGVTAVNVEFFTGAQGGSGEGVYEETVADMFARKARFIQLADIHVALPGGFGTFDEISEAASAADLSPISAKDHPVPQTILVNLGGIYNNLNAFITDTAAQGFSTDDRAEQVMHTVSDAQAAIDLIKHLNQKPPLMPAQLKPKHNNSNTNYHDIIRDLRIEYGIIQDDKRLEI